MLTFRSAVAADLEAVVRIRCTEPARELVALFGTVERARHYERVVLRAHLTSSAMPTVVACDGAMVVGMYQYRDRRPAPGLALDEVRAAVGALGITRVPAFLRKLRARVELPKRPDAFYLVEFAVDPQRRGQGLGGEILAEIERAARASGAAELALDTQIDNPARRLYERHGFAVVAEIPMPTYERLTGVPGRVVMVKPLG